MFGTSSSVFLFSYLKLIRSYRLLQGCVEFEFVTGARNSPRRLLFLAAATLKSKYLLTTTAIILA